MIKPVSVVKTNFFNYNKSKHMDEEYCSRGRREREIGTPPF